MTSPQYPQFVTLGKSSNSTCISLQYGNGFGFRIWQRSDTGAEQGAYFDSGIATNTWYHLVGVLPSVSSRTLYVNGIFRSTTTGTPGGTVVPNNYLIGAQNIAGTIVNPHSGQLAEVAIWNAALTAEEAFALGSYKTGYSPKNIRPTNLISYVPLINTTADYKRGVILTPTNNPTRFTHPRRMG